MTLKTEFTSHTLPGEGGEQRNFASRYKYPEIL